MCLSRTFSKGKIERIIKRLPEEITVYKVVKLNDGRRNGRNQIQSTISK